MICQRIDIETNNSSAIITIMDDQGQLLDEEGWFRRIVQFIREDEPYTTLLDEDGDEDYVQDFPDEDWELLGRDIANNTHMEEVKLYNHALNDDRMACLFRGLTRSSTIKKVHLYNNELSIAAVRSMVPFLQNANNLTCLNLDANAYLESEGFNLLFRALSDSPVEKLSCQTCGIESIEIDNKKIPKNLKSLYLTTNSIDTDECLELTKLLKGGNATLTELHLDDNLINDDGVEILVGALHSNTSLKTLSLERNYEISKRGQLMLLKLVGDVSSIGATLQSNHTLNRIYFDSSDEDSDEDTRIISEAIEVALDSNPSYVAKRNRLERAKMLDMQLHSATRAELAELQGVRHSVYSEIDPLHLPEVLALVGDYHRPDPEELYVALKSSIAGLLSTVNKKQFLKQQWEYHKTMMAEHKAKMEAIEAELVTMEAAEAPAEDIGSESRRDKRRRAS